MMLAVLSRVRMLVRGLHIVRTGIEEIELIFRLGMIRGLAARQLFENRVQADLRVVDLGREESRSAWSVSRSSRIARALPARSRSRYAVVRFVLQARDAPDCAAR